MPESPVLSVQVHHKMGNFDLDMAFTIERWPALLFGPSGAGKSTLLRILAGLETPHSARISLGDRVLIDSAKGVRQTPGSHGVQMVAQRPALFPHLTVRQNIAFGLRGRQQQRIEELLEKFALRAFADRSTQMLSGGERQRVALARALAPRPKLLLLDEAFVGLDAFSKQAILTDVASLVKEENISTLHVSHDVTDAFLLNLNVLKIQNGRLSEQGVAAEVLSSERAVALSALQ